MNLYDEYKQIIEKQDWKYYKNQDFKVTEDVFIHADKAKSFVDKYFIVGGKNQLIDVFTAWYAIDYPDWRHSHTVSTFFLGIYIAKNLKNDLQKSFVKSKDFLWLWFLTCLSHDMGYLFEGNEHYFKEIFTLKDFINSDCIGIKYDLYRSDGYAEIEYGNNSINGLEQTLTCYMVELFKHFYSKEQIEAYFYFRRNNNKKLDHGIAGGLVFFDKMVKNYIETAKRAEHKDLTKPFVFNKLNWNLKHINRFSLVSEVIILHNIYTNTLMEAISNHNTSNSISCVEKLNKTIKDIKYNEDDFSILFILLAISDTFEPIKMFRKSGKNTSKILNEYLIESDGNKIKITSEDEEIKNGIIDKTKGPEGISSWLNVKIKEIEKGIEISV